MPAKGHNRDLLYQYKRYKKAGTKIKRPYMVALIKRDGDRCWLCSEIMLFDGDNLDRRYRSIDHVVSPKDGGQVWDIRNMKLAHRHCNSARQNGNKNVCK